MNRKVKISIILSLIIAVLAAIFVIFCDPIEKIKWSIEQSKIEDKVIYSRWNDKFGWSLCNTYNKSFTLEIFKAYSVAVLRDIRRMDKAMDEMRTLNMGGTAVGTGLNADRELILPRKKELP